MLRSTGTVYRVGSACGPLDRGFIEAAFGTTSPDNLWHCDIDCDQTIGPLNVGAAQATYGNRTPESTDPFRME